MKCLQRPTGAAGTITRAPLQQRPVLLHTLGCIRQVAVHAPAPAFSSQHVQPARGVATQSTQGAATQSTVTAPVDKCVLIRRSCFLCVCLYGWRKGTSATLKCVFSHASIINVVRAIIYPTCRPQLYKGKKAVVVGAGPAGACAAMFLAEQGFEVEVNGPFSCKMGR